MQTIFLDYRTSWEDEAEAQPPEQPGGAGGDEPMYPEEDPTKGGKARPEDPGSNSDEPIYPPEDGDGGTEEPLNLADEAPTGDGSFNGEPTYPDDDPTPIGDLGPQKETHLLSERGGEEGEPDEERQETHEFGYP
jgi:hypothetical protein